ncbi:MAG: helix-turn-helix domain-containing protein [Candidatus Binatia bacterium]
MTTKLRNRFDRSPCPIACTLDLVGDKWTLVIVRDMLNGKSRFGGFHDSPERIPTNILADRLRRMEEKGLLTKKLYAEKPPRFEYALTVEGEALLPVLQEVCRWANKFLKGTWVPPESFMNRGLAKH